MVALFSPRSGEISLVIMDLNMPTSMAHRLPAPHAA
jgi:hypothetical protein